MKGKGELMKKKDRNQRGLGKEEYETEASVDYSQGTWYVRMYICKGPIK